MECGIDIGSSLSCNKYWKLCQL